MPTLDQSYLKTNPDKLGLEPVQRGTPIIGGFPAVPAFPAYAKFLASPLPLVATYQPDALRQFYRGGIPQMRIFPKSNV